MKIKRFKANKFGCLDGEIVLNPDKVTLIVESNEEGKSTFVDGILAGLYGFPSVRTKKDEMKEFYRLKPWDNDSYEIELEIGINKKELLIKRDFEKDKVFIYDILTGKDISEDFYKGKREYPVGEFLLKLPRDVFLKTALIRQHEIQSLKDSDSITKSIQKIVDTSSGDNTALDAIDVLNTALNKYQGYTLKGKGMVKNEINNLNKRITEIESKLKSLDERRLEVDSEITKIEKLSEKEQKINLDMKMMDYLGKLSEIKELKNQLHQDKKNKEKLENYLKELESLKRLSNFPIDKNDLLLQMQGKLSSIEDDIKNEKTDMEKVEKMKEECEKELKSYEEFKKFTENEKKEIEILLIKLKENLKKLEEKKEGIESEKEKIKDEGYKLEDYKLLKKIFDEVSDEDKDFIGDYNEYFWEKNSKINETISEIENLKDETYRIINLRRKRRKKGILLSFSGIIIFTSGLLLPLGMSFLIPSLISGVIGTIYGIALYLTANAVESDKFVELKNKLESFEEVKNKLISEKDNAENKIESISRKYNFENYQDLVEKFKFYKRLDGRIDTLNKMNQDFEILKKEAEEIKSEILRYLKKIYTDLKVSDATLEFCEKFKNNLEKYFSLYLDKMNLGKKIKEKTERINAVVQEKETIEREIYKIFDESEIDEKENIDKGIEKYKEKSEEFNRYIKLKNELIPPLENSMLNNQDINIKNAKIRVLEKKVESIVKEFPDFRGFEVEKSTAEYNDEYRKNDMVLKKIQNEKLELSESVGIVMKEYREKFPKLLNELSDLRDILKKTKNFKTSVELAVNVLERISKESHKNWASILNSSVNIILDKINKNYEDLKFDSDLSFTVRPKEQDRICSQKEVVYQLSAGAKDQIYLSIRLALGKYFSQSGWKLPFIMDDPFITSDDERFADGMKFIISELANEHQVILLTCHKNRHEYLRNINPIWFDKNVEMCFLKSKK